MVTQTVPFTDEHHDLGSVDGVLNGNPAPTFVQFWT